ILTENPIIMRGREKGEICRIMEKGISMPKKKHISLKDYKKAIQYAFEISKKDDIIILADLDVSKNDVMDILSNNGSNLSSPEELAHRSHN
ncbi:MAG: hypothetical protein ACOC5D_03615, partial [Thermoplasmatota archaeon]